MKGEKKFMWDEKAMTDEEIDQLLNELRQKMPFNFTGYKHCPQCINPRLKNSPKIAPKINVNTRETREKLRQFKINKDIGNKSVLNESLYKSRH